jgi:hypothetical protein
MHPVLATLLLLLLVATIALAQQPVFALTGYDPGTSSFITTGGTVERLTRSAAAYAAHRPAPGGAIFGLTYGSTLITVVSDGGNQICEWSLRGSDTAPLRCVGMPTTSAIADIVLVNANTDTASPIVLVAIPDDNTVLQVLYANFSVSPQAWMNNEIDPQFLAPVALEYDFTGSLVYVALEGANAVRRYSTSSDGNAPASAVDSATVPFVALPRPRFIALNRNIAAAVNSLYVLTSDLTLPELYEFRLGDGSSLSVLANDDGDWYPDNITDILDMTLPTGSQNLHLLLEGTSAVATFSLYSAALTGHWSNNNATGYLDPVAIVRSALLSRVAGVVDSAAFWGTDTSLPPFYFDSCTPGMASGNTLDGAAIVALFYDVTDNTTLYVVDNQSIYRLANGCFDGYLVSPNAGFTIEAAFWCVNTATSLPDLTTLGFLATNASSSGWLTLFSLSLETGSLVDLQDELIRTVNLTDNNSILDFINPLAPSQSLGYFEVLPGVACMVSLDSTLTCTDGTIVQLIPNITASGPSSLFAAGALTAAWDPLRQQIWIAFANGSVLTINYNVSSAPSSSLGGMTLYEPTNSLGANVTAFFLDASCTPNWILGDDNGTLLWCTAVNFAPGYKFNFAVIQSASRLFPLSMSVWAVFGTPAQQIFDNTPYSPSSSCNDGFVHCEPERFWLIIVVAVFVAVWIVLIGIICVRRKVRNSRRGTFGMRGSRAYVPMDTFPAAAGGGGESGVDQARGDHMRCCRGLRDTIRHLCCFCSCCYSPQTGALCWPFYYFVGGHIQIQSTASNGNSNGNGDNTATNGGNDNLVYTGPGSAPSNFSIDDPQQQQQQSSGAPDTNSAIPVTEPYTGRATMQSIPLDSSILAPAPALSTVPSSAPTPPPASSTSLQSPP